MRQFPDWYLEPPDMTEEEALEEEKAERDYYLDLADELYERWRDEGY